ncbi:hypothetical protein [Acinetobacter baumannii]|uniref:hypothetical protein n=1 Tax=Acinetobacter baumannii TaxID=470 RepID=UPI00294A8041|nr:hypothetical protein [Acinetobacter baumannii]MDV5263228.1 hypothetical protein [Acinetobacter baumannii]
MDKRDTLSGKFRYFAGSKVIKLMNWLSEMENSQPSDYAKYAYELELLELTVISYYKQEATSYFIMFIY